MRTEEEAEQFSPFPAPDDGSVERLFYFLGQIQNSTVNSDHEGNVSFPRSRQRDSSNPSQRMAMNNRDVILAPQRGYQIKRHQISAHRYELLFPFPGHSQHWHERPESLHVISASDQWVFNVLMLQSRAVN